MHASFKRSICRWPAGLLALLVSVWSVSAEAMADEKGAIRLLSDEAADACIQNVDCMGRLFMQAAFGQDQTPDTPSQPLFKWSGPVQIASFFGEQIDEGVHHAMRASLAQMHLLGTIAGSDLKLVKKDSGDVINFVVLLSADFAKDRDEAFSTLLSGVFAGRTALYDELSSGPSPVCQGHLFAESGASVSGGLALVEGDTDVTSFRRCLHRSVLNVLGLRHPLPEDVDSVLNPDSEREAWTSIDFLLLRMLHDPAIKPGMGRQDVASIFPAIHQRALRPSS
jgi:hypothetical protein